VTGKISRRKFLERSICAGPALYAAMSSQASESPENPPNVILLLTDDQRNDTLGCAGHPVVKTPNIDSLAAQGVRFENCFVTTSICAASRASILTGLYERTHGYTFGKPPVLREYALASYPALLRRSGYRTGFIGKLGCKLEDEEAMFDYLERVPGPGYLRQPDGSELESTEVMGALAADFVLDGDDRPFCLSVSFHAAHADDGNLTPGKGHFPYPHGVSHLYRDQEMPGPSLSDPEYFDTLPEFLKDSMNRRRFYWRWDTPEKYQVNMRAYLRMLSGIDNVVGQLVETLERRGLADNTVIIYTADNGYFMADRGFAGKWNHFEQSLRVPLVVYDPRLPEDRRGRVVDPLALNIDLAPTILELAQVKVPRHYQGLSLQPVVDKSSDEAVSWRKEIFCEHLLENPVIPKWEGVRTRRYKYARYFDEVPSFEFLHDLKEDPTELSNLAADPSYEDILRQMRAKVDSFARLHPLILLPENLKCENQVWPIGIGTGQPRFSWTMKSNIRGQTQLAFQVAVFTSLEDANAGRNRLWDSRKVASSANQVSYQGPPLKSSTAYYWTARIWTRDGKPTRWSKPSWFETALLARGDWKAKWIDDGKSNPVKDEDFYRFDPAPLFRREFSLAKPVAQAQLYISGLGYYEATLNGGRVGDHMLDPGWTDYSKRAYYSTYDVTEQLQEGRNCLGVTLGNGWYNPLPLLMWGRKNLRTHLPVGRPRLIAQLNLSYEDGSSESIRSDESWKVTDGPILRNNIYLGEVFDGRKEIPGWDLPGFDDSAWSSARSADEPIGGLVAQPLEPIRVTATVNPVSVSEPQKGVYIVDFGQNFAGWASFELDLAKGAMVRMRYGELLNKDGSLNPLTSVCGQIKGKPNSSLESHPGMAWQQDVFVAGGRGREIYTPSFTFHAFRYVEITGCPVKPTLDMVTGLRLHTDVRPTGHFSCSNELFNSIQTMCQDTFLSNIFSVQSDCPHRERFAYGGDLVNTSEAYIYSYDMSRFYAKAVADLDDAKLEDGMFTDTAPSVGIQYCGVGWAMAHPDTQLKLYQYYGDKRILRQQYRRSKRWLDLVSQSNPTHVIRDGLGDHESLTEEPAAPLVTILYYRSTKILEKMANILGIKEDARKLDALSKGIAKAYNDKYIDAETGKCGSGTQSSQSFALFSEIIPEGLRPAALQYLLDDIREHDGHLTTGIFGTRFLLELLSREGLSQAAYDIVNQRGFPGWSHMLENGATTLWERWSYSDNTYSHNHPMFGSVSQWFYQWLGGIQPHPDAVGFDRIVIRPQVPTGLAWVKCSYDSVRGKITSNWGKSDDSLVIDIRIPANTTATVYLPCCNPETVMESDISVGRASGIELVRREKTTAIFAVQSGKFQLKYPCLAAATQCVDTG
jgi:alpha-L-rhamnosidase